MTAELLFAYLAGVIIVLALFVISTKNPVHSVLFMLLMFFHIAGLYLTLNAEFLAAIQVMVYAGAILVLFLFVVLLLNLKEEVVVERFVGRWPFGLATAFVFFLMTVLSLQSFVLGPQGVVGPETIKAETNARVLGKILYTEFLYPFEVVSLILLVALIGAIVLAKKKLRS
ncbi:MAG TPA: NADH-quinone oxidoreductase subunit J [Thermodesulfovibrionales bacterium]|jgi:NADH-quinone oxidoreductase subunit J|nr:NADH-quinone oxidoreductase subunit J [Thermodesulfovibrionales bacterium]